MQAFSHLRSSLSFLRLARGRRPAQHTRRGSCEIGQEAGREREGRKRKKEKEREREGGGGEGPVRLSMFTVLITEASRGVPRRGERREERGERREEEKEEDEKEDKVRREKERKQNRTREKQSKTRGGRGRGQLTQLASKDALGGGRSVMPW
eukprot:3185936-Rhodomonas_salina.1